MIPSVSVTFAEVLVHEFIYESEKTAYEFLIEKEAQYTEQEPHPELLDVVHWFQKRRPMTERCFNLCLKELNNKKE